MEELLKHSARYLSQQIYLDKKVATQTRNFRELSRKQKKAGITFYAWIGIAMVVIMILSFTDSVLFAFGSLIVLYIVCFILERIDEDIFYIIASQLTNQMKGNKFYV